MPLNITSTASGFRSAYGPLEVVVTSTRSPVNSQPGESGISIGTVKVADATDVATYGAPLEVGDLFIYHAVVTLGTWGVGQTVKVEGTDVAAYNTVWRILKLVSDKVIVINADDNGTAIGGTLSKHYENYVLFGTVTMEAATDPQVYRLRPTSDGTFILDASDFAQRTFRDVFEIADTDAAVSAIGGNEYITQRWSVLFEEGYNIPDSDGVNVFTEMGKDGDEASVLNMVAVNSVQPYHHIDEGTGTPDLLWEDRLQDYVAADDGGAGSYRWLTYHPSTGSYDERVARRVSREDDHWLGFLWDDLNEDVRIRVFYVFSNGIPGFTFIDLTADEDSHIINVGADKLGVPSDVVRYSVALFRGNTEIIPATWYTIEDNCIERTLFHAFNSFGCLDSYGVNGRVSREDNVKRFTVTKRNIRKTLTVAGDYNRRTYAVEPEADFSVVMRKEPKEIIRWFSDEILKSPDVRLRIYDGDVAAYTPVIFDTSKVDLGSRGARIELEWSLGVDNRKQRR